MLKKAMIAMSGGVDSSVAAYLIKTAGYETVGVTLKLFDNEDIGVERAKTCCSLDDVNDARSVAYKLNMPFYVFNYSDNFKEKVIDKFVKSYLAGSTPNPCIDCNRYIKFEQLLAVSKSLEFDYVVTGHYARVEFDEASGRYLLKKSLNLAKDQSYVLYSLTQKQLASTLFPLGEMTKDEVRKIAQENGFVNSNKPDSQDICFVKDGNYLGFIEEACGVKMKPGNFIDLQGNVLGKHKGVAGYTIGQRKGLGISASHPLYVVKKDVKNNTVILGQESDLYSKSLIASEMNFIPFDELKQSIKVKAKTRYSQVETPATISPLEDGKILVEFETPQRAVTSGQAVVFYDGDVVVGGGTIE